jgi:glycine/D-amino acid oxidase-like deaminating enzyme
MDLKSGRPYWLLKNRELANYPLLKQDLSCEVAVIGGGITGALTAYYLAEAGVDTVLLDKRGIGQGSTCANTALLLYELDTPLCQLIDAVGEAHAVRSYQLGLEAIDELQQLVAQVGDPCGFERKSSLYLASRKRDVAELQREYQARRSYGFRLAYLDSSALETSFRLHRPGALLSPDAAQVDPYRLTHKLLQKACGQGLRVYEGTEVIRCQPGPTGAVLTTSRGCRVTSNRVVFAAGYESQQYLRKKIVQLKSTYALVSDPVEELIDPEQSCVIWETARPYLYLRTTRDRRVLVGGEDEGFVNPDQRDRLIGKKSKQLKTKFSHLFPDIKLKIAYSWAGTFGETKDGLAYIGEHNEFPKAYFALSYGANGTTYAVVAARIIRDLYLGRGNADAAIFRFDSR